MSRTSMYEQVLGANYAVLDEPVQRFHRLSGEHELHGRVTTCQPESWLARVLCTALGTPQASGEGPIRLELLAEPRQEVWIRHFPSFRMASSLRLEHGKVVERLGAARLTFDLEAHDGKLSMRLKRLHFLAIPCPTWLMPQVVAEETGDGDRFNFNVEARVPFIGRVAKYTGHLKLEPEEAA